MTVLVTRPQPQADEWVARLRAAGIDAHALPLLGIEPADPAPVRALWDAPPAWCVFVSPNAVAGAFAHRPAGTPWPAGCRVAAPGPGTAQALRDAGVPAEAVTEPAADASRFDSESLWERLQAWPWPDADVVIVRGEGGRDWLADTLRAAGARVRFVQAYRRGAPTLDAAARARLDAAVAQPSAVTWLFSSSEAVGHLPALAPGASWQASRALASHPRIADAARAIGVGRVDEVRPSFDDVLAALR